MKIINYGDKIEDKIVLCLGLFDGLHLGHAKIIEKAKKLAVSSGAKLALFTFDDGFSQTIKDEKSIFTLSERLKLFEKQQADYIVLGKSTSEFLSLSKEEFASGLFSSLNVCFVVCGSDYRFGKNGKGDVNYLQSIAKQYDFSLDVEPFVCDNGVKISSSLIKKYIENGDIKNVNRLLGFEYFFSGVVIPGVNVGEKIGFPTMNTFFPQVKKELKRGVYKTQTLIDGKVFNSVTNFGTAPTFDRLNFVVETHILDFNQDIYGKTVTVRFLDFIRGIKKFNSVEELQKQLAEDMKCYD